MRNHAAERDPGRNPNFTRIWADDPLQLPDLQHLRREVAAEIVADMKFRRRVQRLHGLGDRVLGEFLAEIGADRGIQTIIDQKLDTYAELEPEALEVAGGDGFWPVPIHGVKP